MLKERKLCFPENRKLRLLQVSDPQDMHFTRGAMLRMLDRAYDSLRPDLVIFTGDNVLGNHLDENRLEWRTKRKEKVAANVKKAISFIADPLEKRRIPFCMIYGNHDDRNLLSKEEQAAFYLEYTQFFGLSAPGEAPDCDTCAVPVYSADGTAVCFNLWLLDSAGKDDGSGNGYLYVKPETVAWYKKTSAALRAANGGEPVPSLMFQHVPAPQVKTLFCPCEKTDPAAVRWQAPDGEAYKLDGTKAAGFADEYPDVCEREVGQLAAIREMGDVCALVFGHDHSNCFTAELEGVNVIQTPGASFRCYGTRRSRGVRLFEIDELDPWNVESRFISYFDLMGDTPKTRLDYFISADEYDETRVRLFAALGAASAGAGLFAVCRSCLDRLRK